VNGGGAGAASVDPYAPRTGSFKVLVYSKTYGFRGNIPAGQQMLKELGAEYGFEPTLTEDHEAFTAEKLAEYELVFFLNTSGDVLDDTEQRAFESWIVERNGGFVGTNRAADTEYDWSFYKELTGQFYSSQVPCCPEKDIRWEPSALEFVAVRGLPSPWRLVELWLNFDEFSTWRTKPGFKVLATIEGDGAMQPVSFVREWANFRSFYTVIGHYEASFADANVRRHIAAGILWTVRREHLLD
jgi:type 1 glutamine amidotransferase